MMKTASLKSLFAAIAIAASLAACSSITTAGDGYGTLPLNASAVAGAR
jgi:hypothetical protein